MAYIENVAYQGQQSTSTLAGDIRLEQGRGRLVIYDPILQTELNVVDRTGYLFSDGVNRRIKIGSAPTDGRVGIWTSKPGVDVIDELNS